jgi:hypothetical protein
MKNIFYLFAILATTFGFSETVSWQEQKGDFSAKVEIPSTTLTIDDLIQINLTLNYPETHHPNLNAIRRNLIAYYGLDTPPFVVFKEKIDPPITKNQGLIQQNLTFYLLPQLPGEHYLTLQKISFDANKDSKEESVDLFSDVFSINVEIPKFDFQPAILIAPFMELSEQPPVLMSFENKRRFLYNPQMIQDEIAANLSLLKAKNLPWIHVLALLAIAGVILLIRFSPPKTPTVVSNEIDKKKLALKKLNDLIEVGINQKEPSDTFITSLDHAVRYYVESAYQIEASTSTTPEFLIKAAANPKLDNDMRARLVQFLQSTDRVKYARHSPTLEECNKAARAAKQLVQK